MKHRQALTLFLLAAMAACAFFQATLPLLPVDVAVGLNFGVSVVALLGAVGAGARRARAAQGRAARGWWAGVLANLLLIVFFVVSAVMVLAGTELREFGILSLLALAANAVQLGLLARPRRSGLARVIRLLDASAISAALFVLSWQLVVAPAMATEPDLAPAAFLAGVLPVILVAAWSLVLVSHVPSQGIGNALHLLGAAFAVEALSVTLVMHDILAEHPSFSSGSGGLTLLAVLLRIMASTQEIPEPADQSDNAVSLFWMVLPYLPVVLSLASLAGLYLWHGSIDRLLLWVVLGAVAAAMARQFVSLIIIRYLVVQLDLQRTRLDHLAHHDPLTGLANRASFQEHAAAALRTTRPDNLTAMLLLDLDGFKPVNDTHGHAVGDAVLVAVAERLTEVSRSRDAASRIGGDEFVILLPDLQDPGQADVVADRIIQRIAQPIAVDGITLSIGASIGIAVAAHAEDDLDTVLLHADNALYAAKNSGRNTFRREPLTSVTARVPA